MQATSNGHGQPPRRAPFSARYSAAGLVRRGLTHTDWPPAWREHPVKGSYDVVIVGGGVHGLAAAYYLAARHGIRDVAVLDKGYIGSGMITPIRKPVHRELLDWEKEFNTAVNRIRYVVERAIANFKAWRIMHTDYRRPLSTFAQTISIVVGLYFLRMSAE